MKVYSIEAAAAKIGRTGTTLRAWIKAKIVTPDALVNDRQPAFTEAALAKLRGRTAMDGL